MQNLLESHATSTDEGLLDVIADKQCISILQIIDKDPKPVAQIRAECGLNLGVVYRKLKLLQKNGLLESFYKIRPDGKKFFLYKSLVKDISASFSDGSLKVSIALEEQNPAVAAPAEQHETVTS